MSARGRPITIVDDAGITREIGNECWDDFPVGDGDGCGSAIVISYGVHIQPSLRGRGIGQRAHKERLERFRNEGYNYAMCTVRRDNRPQLAILQKNGWVRLANTASTDGTPIYIMGKNLR